MSDLLNQLDQLMAQFGPGLLGRPITWIAIGCGVMAVMVLIRMLMRRPEPHQTSVPVRGASDGGVFGNLTDALASQLPESEKEHTEFGQMLKQAGLYSPTARSSIYAFRFLLLTFPLFCAGLLAIFSPREQTWQIMIGGGVISMLLSIIPRLWVYMRRKARLEQIGDGLADMLDMLSMCLGGGMPLSASLDHVAKNLTNYPALADELQIMKRQSEVHSLRFALSDFANRLDTPEVRQVATLLSRGDNLGTSLSGSLLDQADHFRTARRQLATMAANRTPVYLTFPLMFCFAPAVLILLMSPAFLQLADFFNPAKNKNNPLANNQAITGQNIISTLNELDQNPNSTTTSTPARSPRTVDAPDDGAD